jgi:hypothetical protein
VTVGRAAIAVAAAALFLGPWALLHHFWWGRHEIVDTPIYESYGDAMAAGQVPYRDFALEYPPGALPAFLLPEASAVRGDFGSYGHSFEKWMAACGVAMTLLVGLGLGVLRTGPWRLLGALALVVVSPLLLGNVMLSRFDLWPAALTAAALAALLAGWEVAAAIALGAAVAAKLYPVVLLPVALIWVWRRHGRQRTLAWLGIAAAIVALVFLPFAVLAPNGVGHVFAVQLGRPVQIESLPAAFLLAAHHIGGLGLTVVTDHGSQNFERGVATWAGGVSTGLQALALAAVWVAFARGAMTRDRLLLASAASIAAFVAFSKVFSPQFMIWLIPLVALAPSVTAWALLVAGLVLTQLWFPDRYWRLALQLRGFESWLVVARDLVVVALFLVLLRALLQDERLRERGPALEPVEPVRSQVQV